MFCNIIWWMTKETIDLCVLHRCEGGVGELWPCPDGEAFCGVDGTLGIPDLNTERPCGVFDDEWCPVDCCYAQ